MSSWISKWISIFFEIHVFLDQFFFKYQIAILTFKVLRLENEG